MESGCVTPAAPLPSIGGDGEVDGRQAVRSDWFECGAGREHCQVAFHPLLFSHPMLGIGDQFDAWVWW